MQSYYAVQRQCPKCRIVSPMSATVSTVSVGDRARGQGATMILIAAACFLPLTFAAVIFFPFIMLWFADVFLGLFGIAQWVYGIAQSSTHVITGERCTCPKCGFTWLSQS